MNTSLGALYKSYGFGSLVVGTSVVSMVTNESRILELSQLGVLKDPQALLNPRDFLGPRIIGFCDALYRSWNPGKYDRASIREHRDISIAFWDSI